MVRSQSNIKSVSKDGVMMIISTRAKANEGWTCIFMAVLWIIKSQQIINKGPGWRLTKLFLAVEPEIAKHNHQLAHKRDPEGPVCHWTATETLCKIVEDCERSRID